MDTMVMIGIQLPQHMSENLTHVIPIAHVGVIMNVLALARYHHLIVLASVKDGALKNVAKLTKIMP